VSPKKVKFLTVFQWKVLEATLKIPLGETRSYKWVAEHIGHPKAVRAVGHALRTNPYPITFPCHRVIKSTGELGKYAGQYGTKKKRLLDFEKKMIQALPAKHKKNLS
jgi:O-6-methylguanine DNA methyltransferase